MSEQPPLIVSTQEGYDRWSEIYDDEANPLILLEQAELSSILGDISGLSVVDLGCGTGRVSRQLAEAGALVTAVDFSTGMLEKAKARSQNITFTEHDLKKPLPFDDEQFDAVVSCLALEHVQTLNQSMREITRICRTGGFVLVTAMHPAMNLKGAQARFIDPESGRRICPESAYHDVSDYVMTGIEAGLTLTNLIERRVTDEVAEQAPRGEKYLNWPMLLMLRFRK